MLSHVAVMRKGCQFTLILMKQNFMRIVTVQIGGGRKAEKSVACDKCYYEAWCH